MMETVAERYDVKTRAKEKFTPGTIALQDHNRWPGIRLEHWKNDASEDLPESVLFQHGITVNLEALTWCETYWSGHRPVESRLQPGDIGIFPAGMAYSAKARGSWNGLILGIAPEYMQSIAQGLGITQIEMTPHIGMQDGFMLHAAHALARDIREQSPFGPMYGEAIAVALATHMVRHYASDLRKHASPSALALHKRERMREFVMDQLQESVTLAEMAAFMQMDVYSFARWFKTEFGVPPHQYILRARIDRSKGLLQTTALPVAEVALRCGFYSQSHFTTAFRRYVGVAPRAYRDGAW
ncbi:helix-turn-helix domain-containing protein [Undibacterium sp.]|uniref:helix-turn-helix domain-containing protein n=1 Tax=Undibacterium sp. TaxID=1914977 RepID=UPI00374CCA63